MDPAAPFFVGANLPWLRYGGDFGANGWAMNGGLAQRDDAGAIVDRLHLLKSSGVTVLRWFTLCDGRAGLQVEPDGTPAGLDDFFLRDFDTALDWMGRAGLTLLPVLLDLHWCRRRREQAGVQMGGRRRVLAIAAQREALVDRVLAPLFARYGREPLIHAWDVINEPEWATFGIGTWNPFISVRPAAMRGYIQLAAERAHALAQQPVTVGSASTRWLPLVVGLGLDFYQPHWYDKFEAGSPIATRVSALPCDRPVVLGEFPTNGSARSPEALLAIARQAGYAGAMFWSVCADDTATDFACATSGLAAWNGNDGNTTDTTDA
jgi:hypothetical protein